MDNEAKKISVSIPGYELIRELGRGGMSTVYLAVQESLQRQLALKVMSPSLSLDPRFKDRFLREGGIVAQLNHPNIVNIYDIGFSANRYFIAMEYVAGRNLAERIEHGLKPEESVQIVRRIARALQYAHRRGFVHRDIKPSNILFRDDESAVLADFRIAKPVEPYTRLTKTGLTVGTPSYMSPEQIRGEQLDGRSDLYSLGVVFYQMLVGERPYMGESELAAMLMHVTAPIPKLPEHLTFLQPVLDRMLAKVPDERFPDEDEFLYALHKAIAENQDTRLFGDKTLLDDEDADQDISVSRGGEPIDVSPPEKGWRQAAESKRAWPSGQKRAGIWAWVGGVVVIGVLAGALALWPWEPTLDPHTQRVVQQLLLYADKQIEAGSLIEPDDDNAYATYRNILALAPQHEQALAGLQRIVGHFEEEAHAKRQAGDLKESLSAIEQGLRVDPEHRGLLALREAITRQLEEKRRQQEIDQLLARAERQFAGRHLTEPEGDNAAETYQAVLELASNNEQALAGLKRITERLERLARTKQSEGDLEGSLVFVEKGLELDPQHAGLKALQQAITRQHEEKRRQQGITELLAKASQQRSDGKLTAPPGDNALVTYQAVLKLDPHNPTARAGLQEITAHQEAQARRAQAAGELEDARTIRQPAPVRTVEREYTSKEGLHGPEREDPGRARIFSMF